MMPAGYTNGMPINSQSMASRCSHFRADHEIAMQLTNSEGGAVADLEPPSWRRGAVLQQSWGSLLLPMHMGCKLTCMLAGWVEKIS
jgi:hypothetical protein